MKPEAHGKSIKHTTIQRYSHRDEADTAPGTFDYCYWSVLDGNGTAVWPDPLLTPAGLHEALEANAFFQSHFADHGLPYFESYCTSPLSHLPAAIPALHFEDGFTEKHKLWRGDVSENKIRPHQD
ncbi:Phosphomutase-like protein 3 [Emericellopsis cladophorae]|uniref:Phosphomutase-like protein 3 n=1 Tax=Emericellopsis cladophorae TaxID=2686198 RepID=A0A9Q0B874_9HYPO|nr:Phosphomutase-like protein 3 [Emericellopsis cladophorae]KAI6777842.1 Phosphomutase-like protein 3 [Emericellopsis cladophorae]